MLNRYYRVRCFSIKQVCLSNQQQRNGILVLHSCKNVSGSRGAMTSDRPFIACGMYAFNERFARGLARRCSTGISRLRQRRASQCMRRRSRFRPARCPARPTTCCRPHLRLPADKNPCRSVQPFCVPEFDLPGCRRQTLFEPPDRAGRFGLESSANAAMAWLAINTVDSNSGMNLLRHELAQNGARAPHFSRRSK